MDVRVRLRSVQVFELGVDDYEVDSTPMIEFLSQRWCLAVLRPRLSDVAVRCAPEFNVK